MNNDSNVLYYDSLDVEDDGRRYPKTVYGVEIEVDKDEIIEYLQDRVQDDPDQKDKIKSQYNEDIDKYIEDNYDDLFNKYYDELLDKFEEKAIDKVYRNWDMYVESFNTTLNEKEWRHQFPKDLAKQLKLIVEKRNKTEEDYLSLQQTLINCWKTLEKMQVLDSDEVEIRIEDIRNLTTSPNEGIKSWNTQFFDYDDYDYQDLEDAQFEQKNMMQEWEKAVDSFYTTCDYEDVLLLTQANKLNEEAFMLKEEAKGKYYKDINDAIIWAWETYYKYEDIFKDIFKKYGVEDVYDEKFYDLDNTTLENIFKDMKRHFIKELNNDNIDWKKDQLIERFEITVKYEESLNTNDSKSKSPLSEDLIFNYTNKDKEVLEELVKKEANPKKRRYLKNCLAKANYELTFNKLNESTSDGKQYLDKGVRELITLLKDTYDDEFIVNYLKNRVGMDEDDISKYTNVDKETVHIYLTTGGDALKESKNESYGYEVRRTSDGELLDSDKGFKSEEGAMTAANETAHDFEDQDYGECEYSVFDELDECDEALHDTWTQEDEVAERESNDRYYELQVKRDELDKVAIEKEVRKFANENDMDDGEFEYGDKLLVAYDPYNIYVDDISISKEYPTHLTSWSFKLDESLADDADWEEYNKNHPMYSKGRNSKFDRKRYGKYFDKDGHLIPELADEYMSMADDEFDLDIDSMAEALSQPMEFNTNPAQIPSVSPMLNEQVSTQIPMVNASPNIPSFQNSMVHQDSFNQVAMQQNSNVEANYNTINASGIPGMQYDDVCDIELT